MARRRRRRRFGDSAATHAERSKETLREIRRLKGKFHSAMKSPPDCEQAARLVFAVGQMEGAYWIDRQARGTAGLSRAVNRLLGRFIDACVVRPRSAAAARKMRAVWR